MPLPAGTRLGPYLIEAPIGAGGMGEVYRAKDTRLDRDVAIKVLGAGFANDEDRLRRFTIEAQATGALNHPNILVIYDIGSHPATSSGPAVPYLVSELLDGETLRARLDAGRVPLSKAIDLSRQVVTGLAAAHAKGITHRDIKPENLFVTKDGRAKILDFGLARQRGEQAPDMTRMQSATAAGVVLGTVGYMSPEQVRGGVADARSDIFSFGVVLYELLSGERPFVGDSAVQTMNAILTEDPRELVEAGRTLPPALERVVRHCLEKNPDERFQSARDLAFALEALSTTSTLSASAVAAVGAVRPRRRILPLFTAALVVVCVLLAAAAMRRPVNANLEQYRFTPFATDAEPESSAAWSPDGQTIAFTKVVDGVSQIFVRTLNTDTPVQLTRVPTGVAGLQGSFWWPDSSRIGFVTGDQVWAVSRAGGSPELIQKGVVVAVALSPDGSTLATWRVTTAEGRTASTVWLASPPTGTPREYAPAPFKLEQALVPAFLQFSPDGRTLLLSHYDKEVNPTLWRLPFPDGGREPAKILAAAVPSGPPPRIAWMPDSRNVIVALRPSGSPAVQLWLADTTKETAAPLSVGLTPQDFPSVSPDGSRVAFTAGGANYNLVEVPLDGSAVRDLFATSADEHSGAWVPGSRRFVYLTNRNGPSEIRVRSLTEGTDRLVVSGRPLSFASPVPSPDGQRVAYSQFGPDLNGVFIVPLAGGAPTRMSQKTGQEFGVEWSPDGERIVCRRSDGGKFGLRVTRVGSSEAPVDLTLPDRATNLPAWSPDGSWIAIATRDAGIVLTSPDGSRQRQLGKGRFFNGLLWSPDSRTIYTTSAAPNGGAELIALDVQTDGQKVIGTFGADVSFGTPISPGQRFTLGPDGKSFLTTIVRVKTDVWILENFRPRSGVLSWFDWR